MATESEHSSKIITKLNSFKQFWMYKQVQQGMGKAGIPDIMGCCLGRLTGLEVKKLDNLNYTALQVNCGQKISSAGGFFCGLVVKERKNKRAIYGLDLLCNGKFSHLKYGDLHMLALNLVDLINLEFQFQENRPLTEAKPFLEILRFSEDFSSH